MILSLPGLLKNAGDSAAYGDEDHGRGYQFALGELLENLRELRDRTKAGDMGALDEFFAIYVFDDER